LREEAWNNTSLVLRSEGKCLVHRTVKAAKDPSQKEITRGRKNPAGIVCLGNDQKGGKAGQVRLDERLVTGLMSKNEGTDVKRTLVGAFDLLTPKRGKKKISR